MSSLSFNNNNNKKNKNIKSNMQLHKVQNYNIGHKANQNSKGLGNNIAHGANNQIISGYFEKEKSYKEIVIARVNSFLCVLLGFLVMVCLVSYYFVTMGEVSLNQIRKETLALNYENEDLQNKLDNLQSYYNVDMAVAKSNMLQRATKVVELSAAKIPSVKFENQDIAQKKAWSMGY